ncbi:hypothetical protein GCM10010988_20830 [Cnuibacter physcomitrellae]|uniref:Uncharacterized protein n=1 Tax=Cnuibacter physcomitrellae TaxID=1619308 RepID=A0A1X9LNL8_9MICO|nr:hypothetical protein [Cnuibacter physcomitrellae]ARJ06773.1 hypothetical protein B5808_17235 [Cnuibacter physcomitrellae]GGI38790.1 hypothetical protein GCM10010988_20830 [Cnuibacter physcomitrellae]
MRSWSRANDRAASFDTRYLTAPPVEVASAMAQHRASARPPWLPTWRRMLVHLSGSILLWYCFVVFMVIGIRVDGYGDNRTGPDDYRDLAISVLVLAAGIAGTLLLRRWSKRPPSPRARLAEWRQTLTALANGFESRPLSRAPLPALTARPAPRASAFPRFAAPDAGVEFGDLVYRTGLHGRPVAHSYIAVRLPSALPHIYLDSLANGRAPGDLASSVDRSQRLSLEGDFDRYFAAYAPDGYATDALYALTPDVMAALIDDASVFDVEIIDDLVVLSTPIAADYSDPAAWTRVRTILDGVAVRLAKRAAAYRDDRVPSQQMRPVRLIGPDGRRLQRAYKSRGLWPALGRMGWVLALVLLYAVPAIFAFAGFMSVIDDK